MGILEKLDKLQEQMDMIWDMIVDIKNATVPCLPEPYPERFDKSGKYIGEVKIRCNTINKEDK